jgi:type IV pilus assembly protein PilE
MLFVIIIIGILVLIALPNHTSVITKAKAVEAKMQLAHVHSLQKAHFWAYSKYSGDLQEIGFEQESLTTNGGSANYRIEIIEHSSKGFIARAIAVVDFDQDGNYNIWEINEKKQLTEFQSD